MSKMEDPQTLVHIIESEENSLGTLKGMVCEYNQPNVNGRIYPKSLWENLLQDESFKEGMETGTIFGWLGNSTSKLNIKDVATVLTDLEINNDLCRVFAECKILNTPQGRVLRKLIDNNINIKFATNGLGDIIQIESDIGIVDPETYILNSIDIVGVINNE